LPRTYPKNIWKQATAGRIKMEASREAEAFAIVVATFVKSRQGFYKLQN